MGFDAYDVLNIGIKTLVAAVYLYILTRLMGKKQISSLSPYDYVVGIAIGSVAADFSVEASINVWQGMVSLSIWAVFPVILALVSKKSYRARKLLDGTPSLLIHRGQFIEKNIRSSRLTVDDLLEELRVAGAFDPSDVEAAVFETGGRVSVLKKADRLPLTPRDMGQAPPGNGLCVNLVIDAKVIPEHLALIGRDEAWLREEARRQGFGDLREILLACVDVHSKLIVYRKGMDVDDPGLM